MRLLKVLLPLFLFAIQASAQSTLQVNENDTTSAYVSPYATPEDSIFESAKNEFIAFLKMNSGQESDRTESYALLMSSLKSYFKIMDTASDSLKVEIKETIRKIRPHMENGAIYFSQAGQQKVAYEFVKCFLNIPKMPMFNGDRFPRNNNYSNFVLFAATESFNAHEYQESADYFQEYLNLGIRAGQEKSYVGLCKALTHLNDINQLRNTIEEALMNYPNNMDLLKMAINCYLVEEKIPEAKSCLQQALLLNPGDVDLVFCKGNLLYADSKYVDAVAIFNELQAQEPANVTLMDRRAYCYYEMGRIFVNEANKMKESLDLVKDRKDAEMKIAGLQVEAEKNLKIAITIFEQLLSVAPDNTNYMKALSEAYRSTGDAAAANYVYEKYAKNDFNLGSQAVEEEGVPNFNEWAAPRINEELNKWKQKDAYETTEEFKKRVNEETYTQRVLEVRGQLKEDFIKQYSAHYDLENITLKRPYDADHETFKIQTRQGDLFIHVPRQNDEMRKFEQMWNTVNVESPVFDIDKDGKLVLLTAQFVLGNGKAYTYDAKKELQYGQTNVTVNFNSIDSEDVAAFGSSYKSQFEVVTNTVVGASDVDIDVPRNKRKNEDAIALIICNENYKYTEAVEFALNDGHSMRNYCEDLLGVPKENIIMVENGTRGDISHQVNMLKSHISSRGGNAKVFVYYSGHGLPDPTTAEAYLVPVDAHTTDLGTCYPLSDLYAALSEEPSFTVTCFIDACFSGTKRNGEVLNKGERSAVVKAKPAAPKGNMVVFSACTGNETAHPWKEKKHGLFTYFLLKKLKDTKGKANYGELAEYVKESVLQKSISVIKKPQTPTVKASSSIATDWKKWKAYGN